MESVIEIHDSIATCCKEQGGRIAIRLSPAWLHRAPSKPGIAPGDVYTLDADVILDNAKFRRRFNELPTELQTGSISVAGNRFDNCIPFPFESATATTLLLVDYLGRPVELLAEKLTIVAAGEENYVEAFPGIDS